MDSSPATCLTPLRWAGGKRRLVPLLKQIIPEADRVIEPFFGGGSVSLGMGADAVGADTNAELVNFFNQSADSGHEIVSLLRGWSDDRETYLRIRDWCPLTEIERAARFAFLNRTGYFGLYRTNQQGRYNVPYGGGGRLNIDAFARGLEELAVVMQRVSVEHLDYLDLMTRVTAGDLVFLDPPYGAAGDFPFRRYGSLLFTPADHRRLAAEADRCRKLGAAVFITLPNDPLLLRLYDGWSVAAEKWRGERIVEICLTPEASGEQGFISSGGWRFPLRSKFVGESEYALRSGTGA